MKKNILIAAVMFFALSVAAFAQATFTVGSVPETTVACCGQTERTGDISFTTVFGSSPSVTGTITVTYPVPITNAVGLNGIQIQTPALWPAGVATPSIVSLTPTVNPTQVVIGVPMNIPAGYSFRLTGVRVDVSSQFSGSINATASSTYNLLTAGETGFRVIENIAQPLVYVAPTTINLNSVTGAGVGNAYFKVKEGFLDAFGKTSTDDPTQTLSKMIRIKLSTIPAGVTLTFPATVGTFFTRVTSAGALAATNVNVTSANNPAVLYYRVTTSTDPAALETFSAEIGVSVTSSALPLAQGTITATAHIAPIDTGIPQTLIPRYADFVECETAAETLVTITGGSTTLLIPYAQTADVWDTGVAIANTTKDPGLTVMSIAGARAQSGTISFYMYPQAGGTVLTYTTQAGSPGAGLDAAGKLLSGQLYTVMLSQIVTAAGGPADGSFSGYVIVVTNFTNAHGEFFVFDSDPITFVHGALMLVINSDRSNGMEALNN